MIKLAEKMDLNNLKDLINNDDRVGYEYQTTALNPNNQHRFIMLFVDNKLYRGQPGETVANVIKNNEIPEDKPTLIIHALDERTVIIEFTREMTLLEAVKPALQREGFLKAYYQTQVQGMDLKRIASK